MKLIKVETQGFKSFANKISLVLDGSVVGIVGPNGSGKSNINDAIKWVLGEQSIKSLRGDSSDDVIFAGSKVIPASNKAEVSLTFDNKDKKVSVPHEKIKITRVVERGIGSNKYYINGEEAKLRDIKEIAMESGIGKSSLAIISQGTISDIAEASPEQRRGIFEEAAGISKYKVRKKEAIKKLDAASDSLDKIKTIIVELEKQVNPLKRQAEKAKIYLAKKEELQNVEISLIIRDIDFFSKKLEELNQKLEGVEEQKNTLEKNVSNLETTIDEKTSYKLKLENEIIKLSNQHQEISNRLRDIEINESKVSERRKMIINGEIAASSSSQQKALKDELNELLNKINKYQIWEEKSLSDIVSKREIVTTSQSKISAINFNIDSNKTKLLKLRTKLAILQDHQKNKTNLFQGVKNIVENKALFSGFQGIVADIIKPQTSFEVAIESILSSALQHIVVDSPETAVKAVHFLKQNKAGRATFIPLSLIKPKSIISDHQMILNNLPGFLGKASEVILVDIKFEILSKFLLGNIIVADTVDNAVSISKVMNNRYMVVSKEGDIVRSGGVISGGEKISGSNMLVFDEQIKNIQNALPSLELQVKEEMGKINIIGTQISEEQSIIAELNIETAKVREKKHIIEAQFQSLKTIYEQNTKTKFQAKKSDLIDSASSLNAEKLSLQTLLKSKRELIINLNHDLASATIHKTEFEKTLRHLIDSSSEQMTQKNQSEFVINASKKRLSEEYEMTIEKAKTIFSQDIDVEKSRKIVASLRAEIKSLGNVNIDSIAMFEEVNERFTKLKLSEKELFSAQQTIVLAINEMDKIIISKLDSTVKDVNKEFNNVFITMFGGGYAEVKYTTPTNLLETGIDVIARPPGKTIKNLKLFSGGEKSLIAISLLFAILKSKPLPLCILDEVEAALDDANVVRFADYLQELKAQTQFMVITHRVGTMSRVDVLFGATMQKRGVTSFFSVKIEEAKKLTN